MVQWKATGLQVWIKVIKPSDPMTSIKTVGGSIESKSLTEEISSSWNPGYRGLSPNDEVNKSDRMFDEKSETIIVLRQSRESRLMRQDEQRGKGESHADQLCLAARGVMRLRVVLQLTVRMKQ